MKKPLLIVLVLLAWTVCGCGDGVVESEDPIQEEIQAFREGGTSDSLLTRLGAALTAVSEATDSVDWVAGLEEFVDVNLQIGRETRLRDLRAWLHRIEWLIGTSTNPAEAGSLEVRRVLVEIKIAQLRDSLGGEGE